MSTKNEKTIEKPVLFHVFDKYSENWGNGENLMNCEQFEKAVAQIPFYGYDIGCDCCKHFDKASKIHFCKRGNKMNYTACGF